MTARVDQSPTGFVTVAQAAEELTRRGDRIDPSNVSRYLARNPEIASRKDGRCRYVDLAALIMHRSGNLLSAARRDAGIDEDQDLDDPDSVVGLPTGVASEIQQANLRIKQLQVRRAEREDALEVGDLVPAEQVLTVINTVMAIFVSELERAEVGIASLHGRPVAADFRKARKAAQSAAAAKLVMASKAEMHATVAEQVMENLPTLAMDAD